MKYNILIKYVNSIPSANAENRIDAGRIRLLCEKGKVTFGYDDAYIVYNDGTREEAHQSDCKVDYRSGKDYWGIHHIRQIKQFYDALLGIEPLEISGEEALKTQALISAIYEVGKKTMK